MEYSNIGSRHLAGPTRLQVAMWTSLLVAAVFLFLAGYRSFQVGVYRDDAAYVILAQSLVSSDHYGLINNPGEPGVSQFPFGYPLLLSLLVRIVPGNLDAMKALSLVATLFSSTLLFWGWRWFVTSRSYWWALAIVGMYILAPLTVQHTGMVMSEPVFTASSLSALLLAERAARGKLGRWWSPAMSLALVFAVFTRTIGIVMFASVLIYLLLIRKRRLGKPIALVIVQMAALIGLVVALTPVRLSDLAPSEYIRSEDAAILLAPFRGWSVPTEPGNHATPGPTSSVPTEESKEQVEPRLPFYRVIYEAIQYHFGRDLRTIVLPFGGGDREQTFVERVGLPSMPLVLGYVVSALVFLGFVTWFVKERLSVMLLFALLYLVSITMWGWAGPRLLYPIQPQVNLGFLMGVEAVTLSVGALLSRRNALFRSSMLVLAGVVSVLLVTSVVRNWQLDDTRRHVGDLEARSAWLKSNTSEDDIIMTEVPQIDFLYSGRKTVYYPAQISSSDELRDYLARNQVSYVLVAPDARWQNTYRPFYDAPTTRLLELLETLSAQQLVKRLYASESDLVQVFKVEL